VTVEAIEAPAIGRLLAASSYTDGEKVVRGDSRLRSKTRRRGEGGGATALPTKERSATGRRDPLGQRRRRRSDTRGREALQQ
jgi:hypothetical protein